MSFKKWSQRQLLHLEMAASAFTVRCVAVRISSVRISSVRISSVRFELVWFGLVWFGLVWFGLVRFGRSVRCGGGAMRLRCCPLHIRCVTLRCSAVLFCAVSYVAMRCGAVRSGAVRSGAVRSLVCVCVCAVWDNYGRDRVGRAATISLLGRRSQWCSQPDSGRRPRLSRAAGEKHICRELNRAVEHGLDCGFRVRRLQRAFTPMRWNTNLTKFGHLEVTKTCLKFQKYSTPKTIRNMHF